MDLMLNEEQEQIVTAVANWLQSELPVARLRHLEEPDAQSTWAELGQGGWLAIGLQESYGGAGLGLADEALVYREFGRHLLPPCTLGTTLAARVAARAGDTVLTQILLSGNARVALALRGWLYDSVAATHVLTWNEGQARVLQAVNLPRHASIDPAVSLVEFSDADLNALPELARAEAGRIELECQVLCAAMLTGIAEAVRDLSVTYVCERQQFGQPIGAFQAVKHPCADMAVTAEASLAQTKVAALHLDNGSPDARFHVLAAQIVAYSGALRSARRAIQVHGGMGITAECLVHFYLKRTHLLGQIAGNLPMLQDSLLHEVAPA